MCGLLSKMHWSTIHPGMMYTSSQILPVNFLK
uniref:Uncharacterized protein n=1 Tax=Rhizophora mucronata TaxID=61149 RepID=A0A2P2NB87_RHIMU